MAADLAPAELKSYLGILKHALRSIEFRAKHGLVPGDSGDIQPHIDNMSQAVNLLEAFTGQIKDPPGGEGLYSSAGMTYAPGKQEQ